MFLFQAFPPVIQLKSEYPYYGKYHQNIMATIIINHLFKNFEYKR